MACNTACRSADRQKGRRNSFSGLFVKGRGPMAIQQVVHQPTKVSLVYDPRVRSIFFQVLIIALLVFGIWWIVGNTVENLRRSNITTGFAFLRGRAGFDISDRLIEYSSDSTFGRAHPHRPIEHRGRRRVRRRHGDLAWLCHRCRAAFPELADPQDRHQSMSRYSAIFRHCWSSSSGISRCWRCCRCRGRALDCRSARI